MKNNIFGISAWRWNRNDFYEPFGSFDEAPEGGSTVYEHGAGKPVSPKALASTVAQALQNISLIYEKGIGGLRTTEDGRAVIEFPCVSARDVKAFHEGSEELRTETMIQIAYDGRSFAANTVYDGTVIGNTVSYMTNERFFLMALILASAEKDEELKGLLRCFLGSCEGAGKNNNAPDIVSLACSISNNIFFRTTYPDECDSLISGSAITADVDKILVFDNKKKNSFEKAKGAGTVTGLGTIKARKKVPVKEMRGRYPVSEGKTLSYDEEMLVPRIPEGYQITEQHEQIARMIKESTYLPTPKRNFIFVGEGGSGKSESARILAYLADKPLLHQAIDPDSDKFDLCQQVIPDGCGGFTYVSSPLIEAMEKGWWVEVSEADLIIKQGALGYLNPLFDSTGMLQLSTGRIVKRHPETVVFFTMNASYEGCRGLNQAVRDRFKVIPFGTPDEETLTERVMSESGLNDRETVKRMVDVLGRVKDHMSINCITDGVAGVRSLIDWASDAALGIDPWQSAKESIVWRWTFDESEHEALLAIVKDQFTPETEELS